MALQALPPIYLDIREARPPGAAVPRGEAWAQLGAWRTRRKAGEVLRAMRALSPSDAPPPMRVFPARARGRLWWRVAAGPFSPQEGYELCRLASAHGYACATHEEPYPLGKFRTRHVARKPAH